MPEIRLVKKYPHIKDEDVTSIFQEGYIKGFENGRKGAISIEWLREYCKYNHTPDGMAWHEAVDLIIKRWEKENE